MEKFVLLAYLDPGAGSMILQAIVGGSAGLMVLARHLFRTWKFRRLAKPGSQTGK